VCERIADLISITCILVCSCFSLPVEITKTFNFLHRCRPPTHSTTTIGREVTNTGDPSLEFQKRIGRNCIFFKFSKPRGCQTLERVHCEDLRGVSIFFVRCPSSKKSCWDNYQWCWDQLLPILVVLHHPDNLPHKPNLINYHLHRPPKIALENIWLSELVLSYTLTKGNQMHI
jgi:hypothetical protein